MLALAPAPEPARAPTTMVHARPAVAEQANRALLAVPSALAALPSQLPRPPRPRATVASGTTGETTVRSAALRRLARLPRLLLAPPSPVARRATSTMASLPASAPPLAYPSLLPSASASSHRSLQASSLSCSRPGGHPLHPPSSYIETPFIPTDFTERRCLCVQGHRTSYPLSAVPLSSHDCPVVPLAQLVRSGIRVSKILADRASGPSIALWSVSRTRTFHSSKLQSTPDYEATRRGFPSCLALYTVTLQHDRLTDRTAHLRHRHSVYD